MSSLENKLFGPLGKDYCTLFYAISTVGLISMLLIVITSVYMILFSSAKKTFGVKEGVAALTTFIIYFVLYLQNRLQYNMCLSSK